MTNNLIKKYFRRTKSTFIPSERDKRLLRERRKEKHQNARLLGPPNATIWIFGCQRSGTTFLESLFRHDLESVVYGEFSDLTIAESKTVLSSKAIVREKVHSANARYAVIRPLYESDRVLELLDWFPNSTAVWLYRDCPPVVASMINKWGDKFFDVSSENETDKNGEWRLLELCCRLKREVQSDRVTSDPIKAYAKYWECRNSIPFDKNLPEDERIQFLGYDTLVRSPKRCVDKILSHAKVGKVWRDFYCRASQSPLNRAIPPAILASYGDEHRSLYNSLSDLGVRDFEGI